MAPGRDDVAKGRTTDRDITESYGYGQGQCVDGVLNAVIIVIVVAGVALSIAIGIGLRCIGYCRTVVDNIGNPVSVLIGWGGVASWTNG
jgi:hypothetical protein